MNRDEISAQAQRKMDEMSAQRAKHHPQPSVSEELRQAERIRHGATSLLKQAFVQVSESERCHLPSISAKTGKVFSLRVRQITIEEMTVSNLLPNRAMRMIDSYMRRGIEATQSMRSEYGLDSPLMGEAYDELTRVANEEFNGDKAEVAKAWFELEHAVAVAACVDPDLKLYYDSCPELDANPNGLLVWNLDEEDVRAIANHALREAFSASERVETFPRSGDNDRPLEGLAGRGEAPIRAESI